MQENEQQSGPPVQDSPAGKQPGSPAEPPPVPELAPPRPAAPLAPLEPPLPLEPLEPPVAVVPAAPTGPMPASAPVPPVPEPLSSPVELSLLHAPKTKLATSAAKLRRIAVRP